MQHRTVTFQRALAVRISFYIFAYFCRNLYKSNKKCHGLKIILCHAGVYWLTDQTLAGKAYAASLTAKDWFGARDGCELDNATLAIVSSVDENNYLSQLFVDESLT